VCAFTMMVRKSITIPGLLAATVKQRCREFGHAIFTPYAVELVCYDLRSDAKHSITLEIARDTQQAQDAVDRELVARYRPGQPRKGLLVQLVDRIHRLQTIAAASRHDLPLPPLSAVAERVTFPFEIWRLADVRWKELGYRSLSAYITGLIRYDLLVSGPHSSITADCRSKLQRKLTRKTLADRRKGHRRKILLDHLIEEAEGRPVPAGVGTSESPHRAGAAANLICTRKREDACAHNFFSTRTDTHLSTRSEHSQEVLCADSVNHTRDQMLIAELHSRWNFAARREYPRQHETQMFKRKYRRICSPITLKRVIKEAETSGKWQQVLRCRPDSPDPLQPCNQGFLWPPTHAPLYLCITVPLFL
jgi:hypothetical protein